MKRNPMGISKKIIAMLLSLTLLLGAPMTAFAKGIYDDPSNAAVKEASLNIAKQIQAEGIVLLENENSLPLTSDAKVSVFGCGALDPFLGGGGAGAVDVADPANLYDGLTAAGIEYDQDLHDYYQTWYADNKNDNQWKEGNDAGSVGMMIQTTVVSEMPYSAMDETVFNNAAATSDAAIMVISRSGSESSDLQMQTLQLRPSERSILEKLNEKFSNIIVLFNICNVMEMDFLDEFENIKSAAIIWAPGEIGMISVGEMLAGQVNPSGKLADTVANKIVDHPSTENFGDYAYTKDGAAPNYDSETKTWTNTTGNKFLKYEEGIYVGYRYFETFGVPVRYPFGFGLSYTRFDWNVGNVVDKGNAISVDVTVTNNGTRAGKDVVEVYFSAPYTQGGTEKSAVTLGGYAKTNELAPGESQTVTVEIDKYHMASYDMTKGQYILDGGDYTIRVSTDVRSAVREQTLTLNAITYDKDPVTGAQLQNRFDGSTGEGMTVLSREAGQKDATYPTKPSAENRDYTQPAMMQDMDKAPALATTGTAPQFGVTLPGGMLTLNDVYDDAIAKYYEKNSAYKTFEEALYNSSLWGDFLSQLTVDEAVEMISNSGYRTGGAPRLNIPATNDNDGPASIKAFREQVLSVSDAGTAYPIGTALACTWNDALARAYGEAVGEDARVIGTNVWYAPATNMHRNPLAGRNFEYFSEDPILAGKMTAHVTAGAQSKGLVVTVKHFALNDCEQNRMGVCTWADEQTIREIYLRPFEIAVKEGDAKGIMSAFNRIGMKWAGGYSSLLNDVLRGEWGFKGFVVTDQFLWTGHPAFNPAPYMLPANTVYGGGDAFLTGLYTAIPRFVPGITLDMKGNVEAAVKAALASDPIGYGNAMMAACKNLAFMKTFTLAFDAYDTWKNAPQADKSDLASAIQQATLLMQGAYTSESWDALQQVLAEAQSVYDDANANQREVDAQQAALAAAMEALEKFPVTMTIDKAKAAVNEEFTVTVQCSAYVSRIAFANEKGMPLGIKSVTSSLSGDTKTYIATLALGTAGNDRAINLALDYGDGSYDNTGVSVSIDITKTNEAPQVLNVVAPAKALVNVVANYTITNNAEGAYSANIRSKGATSNLGKTVISKTVNADGTCTWVLGIKIGTAGKNRAFEAYAGNVNGTLSAAYPFTMTVSLV